MQPVQDQTFSYFLKSLFPTRDLKASVGDRNDTIKKLLFDPAAETQKHLLTKKAEECLVCGQLGNAFDCAELL